MSLVHHFVVCLTRSSVADCHEQGSCVVLELLVL